nr:hypothetical protein [Macrococcus goetzii]
MLITGCSNGTPSNNSIENKSSDDKSPNQQIDDKFLDNEKKYNDELKKYAKSLVDIADDVDEYYENDDSEEYFTKEEYDMLLDSSERYSKAKKDFNNNIKDLDYPGHVLAEEFDRISDVYSMAYDEHAKTVKVVLDDKNYETPAMVVEQFVRTAHETALMEITGSFDYIGKEVMDLSVGEELANDLKELVYVGYEDDEDNNIYLGILSEGLKKVEIPSDSSEKLITPGFTFKIFVASGMNEQAKEVTKSEYNDTVENYNKEVHPLLTLGTIDQPTTLEISSAAITRWNGLVEAQSLIENGEAQQFIEDYENN